MERLRVMIVLSAAFMVFFTIGCDESGQVFEIVGGNYRFSGGDFACATLSYLSVLEKENAVSVARFNLGNVYVALGETEYGEAEFETVIKDDKHEPAFRSCYNLGIVYFEQGRFRESIESFKHALRIMPGSVDAKKNLEIVIKKMENEDLKRAASQSGETRMTSQVKETLKNAQDKEVYIWKPGQAQTGSSPQNDW